jgi:putative oxidoreductase
MKIAAIIIRVLMGLLFLFSSIAFFFNLVPTPELTGSLKTFNDGITASGYLMQLIKGTELICAIAFISGKFVPLAVVVIFPVIVNIVLVHSLLAPEGLPVAVALLLADLFLAYYYRDRYKTLVAA